MICLRACALTALLLVSGADAMRAQAVRVSADSSRLSDPILVGSPQYERRRADEVLGRDRASLVRSASASMVVPDSREWRRPRWKWLAPRAEMTWNSGIPFSLNDGAQWTGRGLTLLLGGGVAGSVGPVNVIVAPELWRAQNETFPVLPGGDSIRSDFASPWFYHNLSADLPVRFGYRPTMAVSPGESAVWMTRGRIAFGLSTESQWWGPGIRNALLVSNHAGGIPHAFVRTTSPIATRAGSIEAKWIVGALSESRFFDDVASNDLRSLSGAIVTLSPAGDSTLTVGVARVVYSRIDGVAALPLRSFDVIARGSGGDKVQSSTSLASEQLTSLFFRWAMPASSAEVYGEWGRLRLPVSLRSLLVAPQFTQGYTVGAQWLPPLRPQTRLRLQVELTNLEQNPTSDAADTISFYSSSVIAQGYTHRGQVVGAAIGPGSSSQWLAMDLLQSNRSLGAFVGRIRWNTDAYYLQPTSVTPSSYDVSIFAGLRGDLRLARRLVAAEAVWQHRLSFLFQNASYGFSTSEAFDKRNTTLRVRVY
jgi:hypothetical protein